MTASPLASILERLWGGFRDERSGLLYSYDVPNRDLALPTPDELAAGVPSAAGWGTGLEDCAMNGGLLLAVLAEAGDRRRVAELLPGLLRLTEVAAEPGCLVRGVLPDGRSRPHHTSCDQLGLYTYGLWAVARAGLVDGGTSTRVAGALTALAARAQRHGWRFLNEDGSVAGGGERLCQHTAEQAVRLLGLVAATASVTGDGRWWQAYQALCDEHAGARLRGIEEARFEPLPNGWGCYVPEQMQCQLRILATVDADRRRAEAYRHAMGRLADAVLQTGFPGAGHTPAYTAATEQALGDLAWLERPARWQWSRELLGLAEDWTWRDDWRTHPPRSEGPAGALEFVLGWMGRRPRFCHERTMLRWPLTAYHIALLAPGWPGRDVVRAEALALLAGLPLAECRWADTLVEAAAVAQFLDGAGDHRRSDPADRL